MEKLKKNRGITLIALVITIIALLILVGVSIAALVGENGLLTKAEKSKIESAISAVKEGIKLDQAEKRLDKNAVTPETLLADKKVSRTVQEAEDQNYYMYYILKPNAYEGMQGLGKGNFDKLKDIFLIDDNLKIKYIDKNGKEYGDEITKKILDDETEIHFSSKVFSEYVSKISAVPEDELKFKWMKSQTELKIEDPAIDSLQDLVFFPNLEKLTLGKDTTNSPNITSMNGVENCTKLKTLNVYYGPDKDYSAVGNLTNLVNFDRISGNDYTNIIDALKYCSKLENLSILYNNIGDNMKKLEELKNLKTLRLDENKIAKIDGLANKSNLASLLLTSNKISKIEGLENLSNLQSLGLDSNQITDITPLAKIPSLLNVSLLNNPIDGNKENYTGEKLIALNKISKILDKGGKIHLDADKLGLFTNYTDLTLSHQNLTTLQSFKGFTNLTSLNLRNNQITLTDLESQEILSSMENLITLGLGNNYVTNIKSINTLKKLKNLYLNGPNNNVNLAEIQNIISNLDILSVNTKSLQTITNCEENSITSLNMPNACDLTSIPDLSKFKNLTNLKINNNPNISNFENISKLSSLKTLSLSSNNLHGRMIDFSNLKNLTELNLSYNTLWSEDLVNLEVLKDVKNLTIYLDGNAIRDAKSLLVLDKSCKIYLRKNVNLSEKSKADLDERFGNNVKF